ncbi:MAG: hypothetical protein PHX93_00525 [Candidatus Peribacteraceae bacterium]|jgi:hypothetical protein|nr:hypothetical protein [Candidatus Peribacteraceae bacterium]
MASHEHAQALYDEVADRHDGSVDAFKARLIERAREVRQGITKATRSEAADALEYSSPEERDEAAHVLEHAAEDLNQAFRGSSLTLKKLDDDVAGEAQLGTDVIRIDPKKITGGDGVVDSEKAKDILVHEQEHTRQSAQADAETVTISAETYDARAIREMAAISRQKRIDFLSDEYRGFARVTMDEQDRALVRAGQFHDLEIRKNGGVPAAA